MECSPSVSAKPQVPILACWPKRSRGFQDFQGLYVSRGFACGRHRPTMVVYLFPPGVARQIVGGVGGNAKHGQLRRIPGTCFPGTFPPGQRGNPPPGNGAIRPGNGAIRPGNGAIRPGNGVTRPGNEAPGKHAPGGSQRVAASKPHVPAKAAGCCLAGARPSPLRTVCRGNAAGLLAHGRGTGPRPWHLLPPPPSRLRGAACPALIFPLFRVHFPAGPQAHRGRGGVGGRVRACRAP